MIGWVAKRHFGATSLHDLVMHGFLTKAEYDVLVEGRNLLWQIRFALHILTGRGEDRLLFDYQRTIAEQFGYHDEDEQLGVESVHEAVLPDRDGAEAASTKCCCSCSRRRSCSPTSPTEIVPINKRFQASNGFIEMTDAQGLRQRYPFALLEIFLLLEQNPELKGIRAGTIRLIREHRHLIDDTFRERSPQPEPVHGNPAAAVRASRTACAA